ncbi:MAG: glycoside hydrolase family 97 catalytic domain-containing protein [Bacteroidales bacterium]|nr:glycoside hydrolase family 97 catalytic domain-containing protein [Bacteroidales bacterium]
MLKLQGIDLYNPDEHKVKSPNGVIEVSLSSPDGQPQYSVTYGGVPFLLNSPLGLSTNMGDLANGMNMSKEVVRNTIKDSYSLPNIKKSNVTYEANSLVADFSKGGKKLYSVEFRVSNNDVAFRYLIYPNGETNVCVIDAELSGFKLPQGTTTFLCPQMLPMTGFARTAPSYETHYDIDQPMGSNGWGQGFTFPCLFKNNNDGWILISETGTDGNYVGCRLMAEADGLYTIGFPMKEELNGHGSTSVSMPLYDNKGKTPWRTITLAPHLAPIVETTVAFDLVEQKYKASRDYTYGKGAWSWIIGMDGATNYDVQKQYIDFAAAMGWQSILIDAFWDKQIGRDRIAELAEYGKSKGVGLYLWYNSNGSWNDAFQSPMGIMDREQSRRAEMKWMQSIGIRGIKVDFFGGDKQPMMQLYEDILYDANDFGLLVIFHGCTLPRGWERMYPNYAASEAVRASENLHFSQGECDREALDATLIPFIRNTVGSMDFGGSTLNKFYSADNQHGSKRVTSDVFALATAVLFQSPVQHFAMAPNNLNDAPAWAVDFMKSVPTTWTDTKFMGGIPGQCIIMGRKSGDKWYIVGVNANEEPAVAIIKNPSDFGLTDGDSLYSDKVVNGELVSSKTALKIKKNQIRITIPRNGAFVITK